MNALTGQLAALATSLLFTATSTQFTLAGRQVGALVVNRLRLLLAVLWLSLAHTAAGLSLPLEPWRWFWLGLSGIVGLVIGDIFLFQAFVWIGPRLTMLMMSLAPILTVLVAWIFLGEQLEWLEIAGILVTLGGVAWVVLDGRRNTNGAPPPPVSAGISTTLPQAPPQAISGQPYARGLLYGLGAAAGQALGLVLAKVGASGDFSPLSGTLVRMLTAAVVMWAFTLLQGQGGSTLRKRTHQRRALLFITGGSLAGPFLGVTLSLLAVQHAPVGIASTLMALPPVFLLPVSYLFFHERFGWQAIAGTLTALAGVAILFLA